MEGSPLGWKPTTSHATCRIPEGQSAVTLGQEPMAAHGMVSYGLEAQPVQHPPPTGCGQRTPTVGVSVERGGGVWCVMLLTGMSLMTLSMAMKATSNGEGAVRGRPSAAISCSGRQAATHHYLGASGATGKGRLHWPT
jgi:hypothetical protein